MQCVEYVSFDMRTHNAILLSQGKRGADLLLLMTLRNTVGEDRRLTQYCQRVQHVERSDEPIPGTWHPLPRPCVRVGDIVHYVLPRGTSKGEHRPAIVVRLWGTQTTDSLPAIQLQVFTDSSNDFPTGMGSNGLLWATSVRHAEDQAPGTWHWPEEV